MEADTALVDALGAFTADLLSERRFEGFVRGVLGEPLGRWSNVSAFVDLPAGLEAVASELFVVALAAPGRPPDSTYRTVVFACRDPRFEMVAEYNAAVVARPPLAVHRGGQVI